MYDVVGVPLRRCQVRGQLGSSFSPSAFTWVSGVELGSPGLHSTYTLGLILLAQF